MRGCHWLAKRRTSTPLNVWPESASTTQKRRSSADWTTEPQLNRSRRASRRMGPPSEGDGYGTGGRSCQDDPLRAAASRSSSSLPGLPSAARLSCPHVDQRPPSTERGNDAVQVFL